MKDKTKENVSWREALSLNYRAFGILRERCPRLFLSIFLKNAVSAVSPYVGIYLSARIIDELAGDRDPDRLTFLVIVSLVSAAVLALALAILTRWNNTRQNTFWLEKEMLYENKWMDMDFCDQDRQHTHDIYNQIMQNNNWSGWGLAKLPGYFSDLTRSVLGLISAITLTVTLFTSNVPESGGGFTVMNNPLFILLIVAVIIFITVMGSFFSSKGQEIWAKQAEKATEGNRLFGYFGYLCYRSGMALDFRIFDIRRICDFYTDKNTVFTTKGFMYRKQRGPIGMLNAASGAASNLLIGLVYVFVCLKAWAGAFSVGSVTQYVSSVTSMSSNLHDILYVLGDMKNNAVFLRTTFEFLDIPNKMYQGSLTTEKRNDRNYEVEFCDVSFKYPDTDVYVLRHLTIKFRIGERLAVVGMNGSGKTTFIKLLCRLYDPTEGVIKLNGIDIRKYRYDDYMSVFSIVFQDFMLFSLPLGENIAASVIYDEERVLDCIKKAGFSARFEELPDKLRTYLYCDVDKNGVIISGGEAQKLAIARALYKDAPFVILDEPTAALDPIAEAQVYSKFDEIISDKTAVYISHRLSSCRFCDNIAVFHKGSIIQQGTHDQLIADKNGKYYELWYSQAQYYDEKEKANI